MRLFIAEKPDVAKAVCAGLGGGFSTREGYYEKGQDVVTWCYGHMLQLFDPEDYDEKYKRWNIDDLPFCFLPAKRKYNPKTSKQTKIIRDLLKKADQIVHAGDPDDEGQLLVDELLRHFGNRTPTLRLLINDNNTRVVSRAIAAMQPNSKFEHLGFKAEARSLADQLYGYNLTRAYTLNVQQQGQQGVISIGRVQTPILGLVVMRDRAHASHQKSLYYNVQGIFEFAGLTFAARYVAQPTDPLDEDGRLVSKPRAQEIARACKGQPARLLSVTTTTKKTPPPLPYNLLKLQQDASRKFGYTPDETLNITQILRERHRLITYNRSDCQYLNDEQHPDAPGVLSAVNTTAPLFARVISRTDPSLKSRAFNSAKVSAHHAIIPTEGTARWETLNEKEQNVYKIIARAYIAQFYPNYTFDETKVLIEVDGHQFQVTGRVDLDQGWKVLYANDNGNEETQADSDLLNADLRGLRNGENGQCVDTKVTEHETKPPALYTMATLLGDLTRVSRYVKDQKLAAVLKEKDKEKAGEHGGIGTPATRSAIIKTLFERGFLTEKKKNVVSTPLGQALFDQVADIVKYPDMTAIWHEQMRNVKTQTDAENFVRKMMAQVVEPEVQRLKTTSINVTTQTKSKGKNKSAKTSAVQTDFTCKACGKPLLLREGVSKATKKTFKFFGCSGYPTCKQSYFEKNGQPDYKS